MQYRKKGRREHRKGKREEEGREKGKGKRTEERDTGGDHQNRKAYQEIEKGWYWTDI